MACFIQHLNGPSAWRFCAIGLWLFFCCVPTEVGAQQVFPAFDVIRIGVDQGLSHRLVYDVLEDRLGYMWFATREGLNRYDGHRFVVYTHIPGDSLSIPDSKVRRVFESTDGTLWVGTEGGLVHFDRSSETFRRVPFESSTTPQFFSDPIIEIAETPDGSIWVVTSMMGLFRLSPDSLELELVLVSTDEINGHVSSERIGLNPMGQLVLGCKDANWEGLMVARLNVETAECMLEFYLPETGALSAIDFLSDGSAVVAGSKRIASGSEKVKLSLWDGQLKWTVTLDASLPRDLTVDTEDRIWLATLNGVFLLDRTGKLLFRYTRSTVDTKSLSDNRANAITIARDGSVWIATEDGLTVFLPVETPFKAIRHRPGDSTSLGDPRVNAILETSDGTLWIGTSKGIYKRPLGDERFESIPLPEVQSVASRAQERIWTMIEAEPGIIWFGTAAGGLYELNTHSNLVRHLTTLTQTLAAENKVTSPSIDRTSISYLGRDRLGTLWVSTRRDVLKVDSLGKFTLVLSGKGNDAPPDRLVNLLLQDFRGQYWAGNDLGLRSFNSKTGELRVVGKAGIKGRGLSYRSVWSLAETPLTPNALWIGTIGGGLNRYDINTGQFTWYTMAEGLPSNGIYGILVDDKGLLWISTTKGIVRFNPLTERVERFTPHNGLHDDDFDLMAYHKGRYSGKMWFGGPTGLTEFHPDSVEVNHDDFRVNISSITVLDQLYPGIVEDGDTLRLSHTQNSLGFRFSAPDLLHPDDVSFRYQLDGYDEDWRVNEATRPEASYTQLPPGGYTFQVQAAGTGSGSDRPTTHLFVLIVPAFWQTGWFRVLCLILAIALFGWGVWTVQSRRGMRATEVVRREIELKRLLSEREEHERGRLAREIHDGPIQTLYSVNHRLEDATPDGLFASRRDVKELASELRAICEHLRPALVDNLGLEGALRSRVRTLSRRNSGVSVSLSFDSKCSQLDGSLQHTCYRIVQEALSNIVQHSGASRANIQVVRDNSFVRMLISDNGKGFDLPADWLTLVRESHFGLVGMRERAEMQGGIYRIESVPGKGTRIEVEFPIGNA